MDDFQVGERVTYFPIKKNEHDNRHWPATIEEVRRNRYKVKIEAEFGIFFRSVTAKRLVRQQEFQL